MISKKEKQILRIMHSTDSYFAAQMVKSIALEIGFNKADSSLIGTAASELASNIFKHAKYGKLIVHSIIDNNQKGLEIIAEDTGPGIENMEQACSDGFSTMGTLGMGLPGIKRIMDDFKHSKERKRGTKITVVKWL